MHFEIPTIYVSSNIMFLRKQRNMTQEKLGSLLGKHYSSIGKWESDINQPSIEETFKLAIIFDVDWKDFVLTDLSKKSDEQKKRIKTDGGIEVIINRDISLTARMVIDVQKKLIEELDNQEEETKK